MRVISADALVMKEISPGVYLIDGEAIRNAPTFDAEPVRHGHWIMRMHDEDHDGGYPLYHCSLCDRARPHKFDNYCPECGVKMDEVSE